MMSAFPEFLRGGFPWHWHDEIEIDVVTGRVRRRKVECINTGEIFICGRNDPLCNAGISYIELTKRQRGGECNEYIQWIYV